MPSTNPRRRIILVRTAMEIHRAIVKAAEANGLAQGEAIAFLAIRMGHLEDRPMTISDVCATTGQKFSSCHRYLQSLKKRGFVYSRIEGKRTVHHLADTSENPAGAKMFKDIHATMRRAVRDLTELEQPVSG
jgi:sugar-specific transcriptional regulator TrmB